MTQPGPASDWRRRTVLAALAAAPAAMGLGGCSFESDRLTIWAMGNEAASLPGLLATLGLDAGANALTVHALPWSAAHEKLLTGFAGGSLPDLGQVGNSWLAELAAIGAIVALPDRHAALLADQFAAVVDTNRIDGRIYAVPWYVDTRVQFYRKDLFARAGYAAPPLEWDTWKSALHAVKRGGGEGYGVLMPLDQYEHLTTIALSAGADLLRENATRGAFDTPEFRTALGFYKSIYDERLAPIVAAAEIANVWDEFARGYFAIYPSGPWTIGDLRTRLPAALQDRWGTAPNPGPRGTGSAAPGGSSLVVFADGPRGERAWDGIARLLSPEAQLAFHKMTGDLPARRSVWQSAGLAADPIVAPFGTQLEHARALPKVPEWERIVTEMQVVADRMVRGQFSIAEAASEIDRRADRLLAKRRWMLEREAAA